MFRKIPLCHVLHKSRHIAGPAIQRSQYCSKIDRRLLGQRRRLDFAVIKQVDQFGRNIAQPDIAFPFRRQAAAAIDFIHPWILA